MSEQQATERSRLQERILDELAGEDSLTVLELSGRLDRSLWQVNRTVEILAIRDDVDAIRSSGPKRVWIPEDRVNDD